MKNSYRILTPYEVEKLLKVAFPPEEVEQARITFFDNARLDVGASNLSNSHDGYAQLSGPEDDLEYWLGLIL